MGYGNGEKVLCLVCGFAVKIGTIRDDEVSCGDVCIYIITHLYHGLSVFIYDKDTSSKDRYQTWGYINICIDRV